MRNARDWMVCLDKKGQHKGCPVLLALIAVSYRVTKRVLHGGDMWGSKEGIKRR